jgi:hypothetical protein
MSSYALAGPLDFYTPPVIGGPTDGTTVASRELYAAVVSQAVADLNRDLQGVLENKLSLVSVWFRPVFSIPATYDARQMVISAKKQLNDVMLPIALNAVRDYSKPLATTSEEIKDIFRQVARTIKNALDVEASQRMSTFFNRIVDEAQKLAVTGVQVSAEAIAKAVNKGAETAAGGLLKSPWVVLGLAVTGIVGAAWVWRSFK